MTDYSRTAERVLVYVMLLLAAVALFGIGAPIFFGILQA